MLVRATLVAATFVSCQPESHPLPPRPPTVEIVMDEYRFGLPSDLPAGRVVFRLTNVGRLEHNLTMLPLPRSFRGTLDGALRSPQKEAFTTLLFLRQPPGDVRSFAMDLRPGRYGLLCQLKDDNGVSHAVKGMVQEFIVASLR